mgnify:CR=1 FL=1
MHATARAGGVRNGHPHPAVDICTLAVGAEKSEENEAVRSSFRRAKAEQKPTSLRRKKEREGEEGQTDDVVDGKPKLTLAYVCMLLFTPPRGLTRDPKS